MDKARQVLAACVATLVIAGCAVDAGPPPDVTGQWIGKCSNCPVQSFRLTLRQSGEQLTGTLRPTGRSGLGERDMPLQDGRIAGRSITFRVLGADGVPMESELRISGDGKALDGQGRHRANFGLSFTRAAN